MVRVLMGAVFVALLLVSCSRAPEFWPAPPVAQEPQVVRLSLADLSPTPDEAAWVRSRRSQGKALRAATFVTKGSFQVDRDGRRSGLDWDLFQEFSRTLDLPLDLRVETSFTVFFACGGEVPSDVETNLNNTYLPDLLTSVDLYVGNFAVLPWRERLVTMVPLYPVQNLLVGRAGTEVQSWSQLKGKRILLLKDSMQDCLVRSFDARKGLGLKYRYADPGTDFVAAITTGKADYTLDDMLFSVGSQRDNEELSISSFPSAPVRVGWALSPKEGPLGSLLAKFFAKVQENGTFVRVFQANYGISFSDYLNLLASSKPEAFDP